MRLCKYKIETNKKLKINTETTLSQNVFIIAGSGEDIKITAEFL